MITNVRHLITAPIMSSALLFFAIATPPLLWAGDAEWEALFDGTSLDAWRGYREDRVPSGWRIEGDTLAFSDGKGDLVTREEYSDFELELEWKISEGGNSGIFYLATLGLPAIYHGAPEMQILDDDRHADGASPLTSAGSNYALHPAPRGVVHSPGEWNRVRLRVYQGHVQHWLNDELTADYVLRSPEWTALVAASKFSQWREYGQAEAGHIGLQDHGDPVWFRNIRIRRLD